MGVAGVWLGGGLQKNEKTAQLNLNIISVERSHTSSSGMGISLGMMKAPTIKKRTHHVTNTIFHCKLCSHDVYDTDSRDDST